MRITVTGAAGYIGAGVVQLLLERGHDVLALGRTTCGIEHGHLKEWVGDVFEYELPSNPKDCPDVLLHLAWRDGFNHWSDAHLEDLPKHVSFVKRAVEAGVPRFVGMGSMHEVGYHVGAVDESTACNPTTPYGVSKNALRQLASEICRANGTRFQWLRGFYLASNDGRGNSIFSKIVHAAQEGQGSFPFTSGECKYDFLPYVEFCRQIVAVVEQEEIDGIINICSGKSIALGEYIESFIAENGYSIKLDYGKYPDRPYDSPEIWGNSAKIESALRLLEMKPK